MSEPNKTPPPAIDPIDRQDPTLDDLDDANPTAHVHAQTYPSEAEAGPDGVFWEQRAVPAQENAGDSTRNVKQMVRVKRCDSCNAVIALGLGKGLHAFSKHYQSANCTAIGKAKRAKAAQKSISNFFKPQPLAPLVVSTPSRANGSELEPFDLSGSPPPPSSPFIPPSSPLLLSSPPSLVESGRKSDLWTPTDITNHPIASQFRCLGLEFSFGESMYLSYPWHLHHYEQLPYHFSAIESKGTRFRIRSNNCVGMPRSGKSICYRCESLETSTEVERLRERASGMPASGTNYRYFSFEQLCTLLAAKNSQINTWKLQVCDCSVTNCLLTNPFKFSA